MTTYVFELDTLTKQGYWEPGAEPSHLTNLVDTLLTCGRKVVVLSCRSELELEEMAAWLTKNTILWLDFAREVLVVDVIELQSDVEFKKHWRRINTEGSYVVFDNNPNCWHIWKDDLVALCLVHTSLMHFEGNYHHEETITDSSQEADQS